MLGIDTIVRRVFGTSADRLIKKLQPTVAQINALESKYKAMEDADLKAMTPAFKEKLSQGASLDDILPDAFAVVREASFRVLEMRHYDVQLIGGMVLHRGMVAEMKTGEGKTLVATTPVYLNALTGKGVHVVTVNDYLAARDAEWMGQIYRFLGMSVGTILSNERNERIKRDAYGSDITYGTNNEFGFDYLRDNMKFRIEDYVQRGHNFAIVDEVDSILIDEARTPLIISGPASDSTDRYVAIDKIIPLLQKEVDFTVDEKQRAVSLTDEGMDKVESQLSVDNLYDPANMELLHHVNQALKAHFVFRRDKDYVVQPGPGGGKVVIVDEHTGRLMPGRRWSDGLHQAVEAKERVSVEAETQTYATVTFQNFFRMYGKLAGMTGTAETEAEEFANIYKLEVVPIPTNRVMIRKDLDDVVYFSQNGKFIRVLKEIEECNKRGQPILIGTTSVEKSELVERMLQRKQIPYEILNAKNHAREAEIVAQAGRKGAVTISTNMAGRGTDIKLGGDPEGLTRMELGVGAPPELWKETLARYRKQCEAERQEVVALGGLFILGTERHESRRIDNQLRGRSGRQGDPGTSRFFLSLEDDLMRLFANERTRAFMQFAGMKDEEPIEHRWVTRSIEDAQRRVEGHHFNMRKNLLEYDDVMNLQRKSVYDLRKRALTGENIRAMMVDSIQALTEDLMDEFVPPGAAPEKWKTAELLQRIEEIFELKWEETPEAVRDYARVEIRERINKEATVRYEKQEAEVTPEIIRSIERQMLLFYADQFWKDHLLAIDRLRDGIGLRGYGQRNPLLEYKKEAYNMFMLMNSLRDEAVIKNLIRIQPQVAEVAAGGGKAMAQRMATGQLQRDLSEPDPVPAPRPEARPDPIVFAPPPVPRLPAKGAEARLFAVEHSLKRNDPCPCGSGQKFKKCCYEESEVKAAEAQLAAARAELEARMLQAQAEAIAAQANTLQSEADKSEADKSEAEPAVPEADNLDFASPDSPPASLLELAKAHASASEPDPGIVDAAFDQAEPSSEADASVDNGADSSADDPVIPADEPTQETPIKASSSP
jgi:preprotein translocase subunit SecA